jgi:hypothetical protein
MVGDRERIERHAKPGVPKPFQGKHRHAHGANDIKVGVCDNTLVAAFQLIFSSASA